MDSKPIFKDVKTNGLPSDVLDTPIIDGSILQTP